MSDNHHQSNRSNNKGGASQTGFFTKNSGRQQLSPRGGGVNENNFFGAFGQTMPGQNQIPANTKAGSMTIEEFRKELARTGNQIDDKLSLLRAQFPQDPTIYDAGGHSSQSLSQIAALTAMVGALSPQQIQMLTLVLTEWRNIQSANSDNSGGAAIQSLLASHSHESQQLMVYLPQLQSLLLILQAKVFSLHSFQELIQNPSMCECFCEAYKILAEWTHYLAVAHSNQLRPIFIDKVQQKCSEVLQHLVHFKETALIKGASQASVRESPQIGCGGAGSIMASKSANNAGQLTAEHQTSGLYSLLHSLFIMTVGIASRNMDSTYSQLLLPLMRAMNMFDVLSLSSCQLQPPQLIANQSPLYKCLPQPKRGKTSSSLIYLILKLSLNQVNQNKNSKGSGSLSILRNDKFNQTLTSLQAKLTTALIQHKAAVLKDAAAEPGKQSQKSLLDKILRYDDSLNPDSIEYNKVLQLQAREGQLEWLSVSQACLELAVQSFLSVTRQQQSLGPQATQLINSIFNLFKAMVFSICDFNLFTTREHFNDTQEPLMKSARELLQEQSERCPLVTVFQKLFEISSTENVQAFSIVFNQFEETLRHIVNGYYQDNTHYLGTVFLVFLDELCSGFQLSAELLQKDLARTTVEHLLKFYSQLSNFPDSRVKDIEQQDYLKNRGPYRIIFNKFKSLEARHDTSQFASREAHSIQAATLANRALAQQQCFDLLKFFSHYKEVNSDLCINFITKELQDSPKPLPYAKAYSLLKLTISVMSRGESVSGNRGYYEILVTGFTWPINQEGTNSKMSRGTETSSGPPSKDSAQIAVKWQLVEKIKTSEEFAKFWQAVSVVLRAHFIALQGRSGGRDKSIIGGAENGRAQNIIPKQEEEEGQMNESTFTIFKRLYIYGTLNLEMFNILYPSIKEILKEVKNSVPSFDLKLSVLQMLLLCQDQESEKHNDTLKSLTTLLKHLNEYIVMIYVKHGSQKPPSSSTRPSEGGLSQWETERIAKITQIKTLVGQSIAILAHYIDFKEQHLPQNLSSLDSSTEPWRPLDMIYVRKEQFELMLIQLKRIILSSNMHGGYLVEQLLRVFFYERRGLQNLCLIVKNSGNELLVDTSSKSQLEALLTFVVEATEVMQGNAQSMVKSLVSQLHYMLISPANKRQQLNLMKFSMCISQLAVKQIKRVMIYIREREDALKDSCIQMKEIVVKALAANPNSTIYREFLAFFREIFYYNKDMDQVDFDLACDTLEIYNALLKSATQSKEVLVIKQSSYENLNIQDYFHFSNIAPGAVITENLKIPQGSFTISLLFKINLQQLQAQQERTGKTDHDLTFFQILDKSSHSESYPPFQIIIHIIKDRMKVYDYDVKIDENWHLLTVFFDFNKKSQDKNFYKVKFFIDSLQNRGNYYGQIAFSNSNEHIFAYGVDARDIIALIPRQLTGGTQPSHQRSTQLSTLQPFVSHNNEFKPVNVFQGSLSIPFMFTNFSEIDKSATDAQKRAIQDFLIECISRKQTVGITSVAELAAQFKRRGKLQGKESLAPFESHDFNEEVIIKHQRAIGIQYLGAVHRVLPHDAIVVLGGFKMLYPIFEKSMQSNLTYNQKADIWRNTFKILRTFMNIEPAHVLRLYKNKHLIQTIKSCLFRGGINHKLLTKELIIDLLNIARDANTNRQAEILEDFYIKYVFEVLLDETFCDMYFIDMRKSKRCLIFEEVVDCISQMFTEEDKQRESYERAVSKQPSQSLLLSKKRMGSNEEQQLEKLNTKLGPSPDFKEFFTLGTARDIYKLFLKLIIRYQEAEYIKHTKKLAMIMMKIILRDQQDRNFIQLMESIQNQALPGNDNQKKYQGTAKRGSLSKASLLAMLKIFEGVIKHPKFLGSLDLIQALKNYYKRESMDALLNQSASYNSPNFGEQSSEGRLEDEIIAITLRIIIDVQGKLSLCDQPKPIMPPRHMYVGNDRLMPTFQEERSLTIYQIFKSIIQNPRGIYLQKTLCSLIITSLEKRQRLRVRINPIANQSGVGYALATVKYNAQFLREILKEREINKVLELMGTSNSDAFDHELFGLTIKLFKWYDLETKKIFLDFYRQLIEDQIQCFNIEEVNTFKTVVFLDQLRPLLDPNQETYLLNIISVALKSTESSEVVKYAELIVLSVIKGFFNTSLQMITENVPGIEGVLYEEELKCLKTIKKLFIIMEQSENTLMSVSCQAIKYVQDVVNWVWSYVLHDTNRTNLNLKLLLFIQLIEETFMKRIGQVDQSKVEAFLNNPLTYELMARLIVVFEDTKMLYFDYPNPLIIETNKRNTMLTGIIRFKESFAMRDVTFSLGGSLRVFLSMLLQMVRKVKPVKSESPNNSFNLAIELMKYYLFKEESNYVMSFRPVPTIEPPTHSGAPLFKMMFNQNSVKKTLYVLQPIDLTKQFIEQYNDTGEHKESITLTLGLIPLLLINELHEIIKRKYAHLKADSAMYASYSGQIATLLRLLKDVIIQSYVNEKIKESIGYVMLTVTDPRLKEELYASLNPQKLVQRGRFGATAKPYFLSKAYEFVDLIRQTTEIGVRHMGSEIETPGDILNGWQGLQTIMRDGHFRQSANLEYVNNMIVQPPFGQRYEAPFSGFTATGIDRQVITESNNEDGAGVDDQDENQLFNDADLDPIKKIEDLNSYNSTKDYNLYQEELILYMNKCFSFLDHTEGETSDDANYEFVRVFKEELLSIPRIEDIMSAFRLVSSEKFRHVYSYSFNNREEQEIKQQLKNFQVNEQGNMIANEKISNLKISGLVGQIDGGDQGSARTQPIKQPQTSEGANLEGAQTQSPEKPLRILYSEGEQNMTPLMIESKTSGDPRPSILKNERKRSADDTDNNNMFEFQSSDPGNQIHSQTGSQGKVSLASSSRPPLSAFDMHLYASQTSLSNQRRNNSSHRTLDYYYIKQCYSKIVKELMELPSSIWYDNLEQMKKDYQDMKEIYDIVNAAQQQSDNGDALMGAQCAFPSPDPVAAGPQLGKQASTSTTQPTNVTFLNGYRPRQYDHFVRLRKSTDLWGRSLLLKPDRKYKQRKFLVSHKYFVHDMLKNLFAVSLLEDADFPDYQSQLKEYLEKQTQINQQQDESTPDGENPQQSDAPKKPSQSEQFKRLREFLLQRIEQNDFLYTLLTNPEEFMSENGANGGHFDFHPITIMQDATIVWSGDAQQITVEGGMYGELYLSGHYLMFKSKSTRIDPSYKFAIHQEQVVRKKNKVWNLGSIEQVFKRRFALYHQAFEIFTREKKSYFFNLLTEEVCGGFFSKLSEVIRRLNKALDKARQPSVQIIEKPKFEFKQKHYLEEWTKGERSTQEFLLLVNKYSGRSFNDFSQYPIFPWIVADYQCSYIELMQKTDSNKQQEDSVFRDLTKNSGVLSDLKLEVAKTQYAAEIDQNDIYGKERYHLKFGTSNRLFCLSFLIRMEPFTDNFIKVNGNLDNPDRIFFSFKDQWRSILEDKQNNSELTPEFFFFPEIFRNHNLAYLGRSRSGHSVNEVELPSWAKNEHDFVRIHRELLESKAVQAKLRFWVDLTFGSRQADEEHFNVFYCYCYENYVRPRKDELDPANINMIMEFMQVPQQIFTEPLFKIDRKQQTNIMQSQALHNIEEEPEDYEENSQLQVQPQTTPRVGDKINKQETRQVTVAGRIISRRPMQPSERINAARSARDHFIEETKAQPGAAGGIGSQQDLRNSSLIQKFIECAASQNRQRHENEMKKIQESHKIDRPEERNIFHMSFSQLNGRCFVFLAQKDTGSIQCVACRESFLQEELKHHCNLGLKLPNLRGDFNNIFQLYGGGIGDRLAGSQRSPLLFTCQNLDNSIKIFDLSIKKGQQLVHQERTHNNIVTAIKFSSDFHYFISGDQDGVIHHYQRTEESGSQQYEELDNSVLQDVQGGGGRFQMIENSISNRKFPFTLKLKFQDQYKAIIAIDTNYTLDMYVTASRDGTIALRCLKTSALWKLIPIEKLQAPSTDVLTLKLSLHGYIILMMKELNVVYTFVYSLNGDLLVSTKRESEQFEFKYAQLTSNEDNLIMVFNQKLRKDDREMQGVIRVSRLFDLEKEPKRDNLQRTFYPMIHQIIYPETAGNKTLSKALSKRDTQITGDINAVSNPSKYNMPAVNSFALSQDESKMNLFLKTGEIICFDESRSQIIEQLDDFGLA